MQDFYKKYWKVQPRKKTKSVNSDSWYDSNKKYNQLLTELFIRERKLSISIVFITKSYFTVPKYVRLSVHILIMKIPNKQGLHQIVFYHSLDNDFKDSLSLLEKCIAKTYYF